MTEDPHSTRIGRRGRRRREDRGHHAVVTRDVAAGGWVGSGDEAGAGKSGDSGIQFRGAGDVVDHRAAARVVMGRVGDEA